MLFIFVSLHVLGRLTVVSHLYPFSHILLPISLTWSPTGNQSPAGVIAANAKGSDKHKVHVLTLGITLILMKKMLRLLTKYLLLILVYHQWALLYPHRHTCLTWQHSLQPKTNHWLKSLLLVRRNQMNTRCMFRQHRHEMWCKYKQ